MKLRPTKADRKALDKLKEITGETTYTKALMEAAKGYPVLIKTIAGLQDDIGKLHNTINNYERAGMLVMDGLEMLKRLNSNKDI